MSYESPEIRLALIQKEILDPNSEIYLENLLDLAASVSYDIHTSGTWKNSKPIKSFLERYSNFSEKAYKYRVTVNDFECLKTIGQGGFGRVDLVRHKQNKNIYAMKVIEKNTYIQNAFNGFWEERDILAKNDSDWLVKCFYAFMDLRKLYIVMEYMPGGNLYHWLSTLEELNEEQTLFYAIEMLLAIETVHKMDFLHRDLKPDNMLLDRNGHLKLADFGTCIRTCNGKVKTNFQVGTPDYIAPEVLRSASIHDMEVGFEIDWWAFGIVVFELFYGETPFEGESTATLYKNIMCYQTTLCYPDDKPASNDFIDFLKNILTEPNKRMTGDAIKGHKYITNNNYGLNLDNIRQHPPPLKVEVSGEADTQYAMFDPNDKRNNILSSYTNNNFFSGENLAFTGFTFNRSHQYGLGDTNKNFDSSELATVSELQAKLLESTTLKDELSFKLEKNLFEFNQIETELSKLRQDLVDKDNLITLTKKEQNQSTEYSKQLKTKMKSLTKQYESLQKEMEQLMVAIMEKDGLIKNMKLEIYNYTENISILKNNLQKTEQKLIETNIEIEEKNSHIETLSKLEVSLEEERNHTANLSADVTMKIRIISDYEKQLESLNKQIFDLISSQHKASNNDSISKPNDMQDVYDKWLLEKQTLESKISHLHADLKEIQSDRDVQRSENRTLLLKVSAAEKTKEKLSKELSVAKSQVKIQQHKVFDTEDQIRILKQKINVSESEMNELQSKYDIFKSMSLLKAVELDDVQKELEESKRHYEQREQELKVQVENLTNEIDQLNKSQQQQINNVIIEKNDLSKQISKLEIDIKTKNDEMEKLTVENKKYQNDIDHLNKMSESEKQKFKVLEETFYRFVNNPNKYVARYKKEAESKESLKQIKKLEKDLDLAKVNMNQKLQEVNELKNDCESWRIKVKELEQNLEKKECDIRYLVTKIGGTYGPGVSLDEDVAKMSALSTCFEDRIEILKKGKGRHKMSWLQCIGRLKPFRMEIFQNGIDNPPLYSIDLRNLIHVKDTTQADYVHVDKNLLPQMLQIMYDKPDVEEKRGLDVSRRGNRMSLLSVYEHTVPTDLPSQDEKTSGIFYISNHNFILMTYKTPQICDFCNQSCSDLINPPACYECVRCKKRFHASHESFQIQMCQDSIEVLSIKLQTNEIKVAWFERLMLLKKYQMSEEGNLKPNTYYRSVRHSPSRTINETSIS